MTSEYFIRLNPNNSTPVKTGYTFKTGDKGAQLKITVEGLDYSSTTAKIVFKRSNGTSVERSIAAANNVYVHTIQGTELAVPGIVVADVKFYQSSNRVSTASFIFMVIDDTMDGLGTGTAGYSDTLAYYQQEMLAAIANLQAQSAAYNASLASFNTQFQQQLNNYIAQFGNVGTFKPKGTYNASTTYKPLDFVYYNGASWVCRVQCTGQTPADGTYWQELVDATTFESRIAVLEKALEDNVYDYPIADEDGVVLTDEDNNELYGTNIYILATA